MRPSQYHYIKRMLVHGMYNRKRTKIAAKNRKKQLKILHKEEKRQRKMTRKAWKKAQKKLYIKMNPVPKVIHTSRFYRNITIAIFFGWFILWFYVICIPARPSDSFLDSLFLLSGWVMFIPYPLIRYLTKKKKETVKQDMMNCPFCGSVIASSCKFCTACGSSLIPQQPKIDPMPKEQRKEKLCSACGSVIDINSKFCPCCGYKIVKKEAAVPTDMKFTSDHVANRKVIYSPPKFEIEDTQPVTSKPVTEIIEEPVQDIIKDEEVKSTSLSKEERGALIQFYKEQYKQKKISEQKAMMDESDRLRRIKSQNYKLKKEDDKENRDQYDELTK